MYVSLHQFLLGGSEGERDGQRGEKRGRRECEGVREKEMGREEGVAWHSIQKLQSVSMGDWEHTRLSRGNGM